MINKKFIAYIVFSNTGAKRYLYRETATNGKDVVIIGKNIDPVKTIEEIAGYFFNIFLNNTYFSDPIENTDLYEIILNKLQEISNKLTSTNKVSVVFYLVKDKENMLLLNERTSNSKTKHILYTYNVNTPDVNTWVIDTNGNWNDDGIWDDTKVWNDSGF